MRPVQIVLASLVLASCLAEPAEKSSSLLDSEVLVGNLFFDPRTLLIEPEDVVTWRVVAGRHSVISSTEAWEPSPEMTTGQTFSHTFESPGQFPYFCGVHGAGLMSGNVAVAHIVNIRGNSFQPRELDIQPGDWVTWINRDGAPHTSTHSADPRLWDSGLIQQHRRFSFQFLDSGTFDYRCRVPGHGFTGVIRVAQPPTVHEIDIVAGGGFEPSALAIAVGESVRWTNRDTREHTVTFETEGSGRLGPGQSYVQTFGAPGTRYYFCALDAHCDEVGVVEVQE